MAETKMDHVEKRREQWRKELPDMDTRGMAILGRARVITHMARPPIEAVFERHGLTSGEFDVLSSLLRAGPPYTLRPTELYNALMITSGGLTGRLTRLEYAGMIERPANPDDARSSLVRLTRKGLEVARTAIQEDMKVEAELLECISPDDQETLAALLAKLAISLEEKQE